MSIGENKMWLATIWTQTWEEVFMDIHQGLIHLENSILEQRDNAILYNRAFRIRLIKADTQEEAEAKLQAYCNEEGIEWFTYDLSEMIE